MDYNRGKIGEFDEPVKRKAGRPVSEFTEKIAIYMTKDMLDYMRVYPIGYEDIPESSS